MHCEKTSLLLSTDSHLVARFQTNVGSRSVSIAAPTLADNVKSTIIVSKAWWL